MEAKQFQGNTNEYNKGDEAYFLALDREKFLGVFVCKILEKYDTPTGNRYQIKITGLKKPKQIVSQLLLFKDFSSAFDQLSIILNQ